MKTLKLTLGSYECEAVVNHTACPITADAVWSMLPASFFHLDHARFSGEEVSFPVGRLPEVPLEMQSKTVSPGDIGYFMNGVIGIFYGNVSLTHPVNIFARIADHHLAGTYKVGKAAWYHPRIPVKLERSEGEARPTGLGPLTEVDVCAESASAGRSPDVEAVLATPGVYQQRLTTLLAAYSQTAECRSMLAIACDLLTDSEISARTAGRVVHRILEQQASAFAHRSTMVEAPSFLRLAAERALAARDGSTQEELLDTLRRVDRYILILRFALSAELPWHEVACAFEGARALNEAVDQRPASSGAV